MDHFTIDFDFVTTAPTVPAYNAPREIELAVGSAGRAIHADVTLVRTAGVVSVRIAYTWFGAMGRDGARVVFVNALRAGPRQGGPKGPRSFLRAVRDALREGAEIL